MIIDFANSQTDPTYIFPCGDYTAIGTNDAGVRENHFMMMELIGYLFDNHFKNGSPIYEPVTVAATVITIKKVDRLPSSKCSLCKRVIGDYHHPECKKRSDIFPFVSENQT